MREFPEIIYEFTKLTQHRCKTGNDSSAAYLQEKEHKSVLLNKQQNKTVGQ